MLRKLGPSTAGRMKANASIRVANTDRCSCHLLDFQDSSAFVMYATPMHVDSQPHAVSFFLSRRHNPQEQNLPCSVASSSGMHGGSVLRSRARLSADESVFFALDRWKATCHAALNWCFFSFLFFMAPLNPRCAPLSLSLSLSLSLLFLWFFPICFSSG